MTLVRREKLDPCSLLTKIMQHVSFRWHGQFEVSPEMVEQMCEKSYHRNAIDQIFEDLALRMHGNHIRPGPFLLVRRAEYRHDRDPEAIGPSRWLRASDKHFHGRLSRVHIWKHRNGSVRIDVLPDSKLQALGRLLGKVVRIDKVKVGE